MNASLCKSLFVLTAPSCVMACDPTTSKVEFDLPSTIDFSDGFQQSDADAILSKCGAQGIGLTVKADGQIDFDPSPDADYEASVCVLEYLKKSGATKIGVVGNDNHATPEEGQ